MTVGEGQISPLHLRAEDETDLTILAACLQDALVMVGDMTYLVDEQRFVLVANRFVWEAAEGKRADFERVTAGVSFGQVTAVKYRNINLGHGDRLLSLLTIQATPGALDLTFAGDADIRLETGSIQVLLQDIGEAWPTPWRPSHD
jgi:hypothetical protein